MACAVLYGIVFAAAQTATFMGRIVGFVDGGTLAVMRGTANDWLDILGNPPVGRWELKFQDTSAVRALFDDDASGHIQDLLLAVTYDGEAPPWPA